MAAITGLTDYFGDKKVRALRDARHHMVGNIVAVLIALANFLWRYTQGEMAVVPLGLVLSLAVAAILLFTGWKGGELVYRHRVGIHNVSELRR